MDKKIALEILALALEKGIPAVTNIIQAFEKEEITLEDISALRDKVQRPEEY